MSTPNERTDRRRRAWRAAASQGGVLHRRQLYGSGVTRHQIRAEVQAGRWRLRGRQTVAVHTGPLDAVALRHRAVFETGADAALDGVSALIDQGLEHFTSDVIHVSVSKGTRYRRSRGVRVHETRRRRDSDVVPGTLPRVLTEIAAIRGALWAKTGRQAALVLVLVVQQGLCTPAALAEAFAAIRRDKRRRQIKAVLADLASGVQAMGELDFARACRRYGLPPPSRQVRRQLPNGRVFLDVYWDQFRVVVEIEGMQHLLPGVAVYDSLRQNQLTIEQDRVLRIPVLGLRTDEASFMAQVVELLRRHGWQAPAEAGSRPPAA